VHFIRAALAPGALLAACALATGCGPTGTTNVEEPAVITSSQTVAAPAPKQTTTPKPTTPKQTTPPKPTTIKKVVVEFRTIPFKKKTVTDDSLAKGETVIRTRGANGTRRLTYEVTFVNGVQTAKTLLRQEIAKQPTTQVTVIGTKVSESSNCDPNYSGACVPIASDVDCAGGSGNGPAYVRGPVTVVGNDIYDLDRDNDGVGCED
jgi:hypothetical protein